MTSKIPVFENVNRDMESVTKEVRGGRIEEMQLQGGGAAGPPTGWGDGWDRQTRAEVSGACGP